MKRYQTGEITLLVVVMVGMMAWMISGIMSNGHMGMIGMAHGARHDEKPMGTAPPAESSSTASAIPAASPEHPH